MNKNEESKINNRELVILDKYFMVPICVLESENKNPIIQLFKYWFYSSNKAANFERSNLAIVLD